MIWILILNQIECFEKLSVVVRLNDAANISIFRAIIDFLVTIIFLVNCIHDNQSCSLEYLICKYNLKMIENC